MDVGTFTAAWAGVEKAIGLLERVVLDLEELELGARGDLTAETVRPGPSAMIAEA